MKDCGCVTDRSFYECKHGTIAEVDRIQHDLISADGFVDSPPTKRIYSDEVPVANEDVIKYLKTSYLRNVIYLDKYPY